MCDEKIAVHLDKLQRLQTKLARMKKEEEAAEREQQESEEETEEENEEEMEEEYEPTPARHKSVRKFRTHFRILATFL